jgi:hypothetical protein
MPLWPYALPGGYVMRSVVGFIAPPRLIADRLWRWGAANVDGFYTVRNMFPQSPGAAKV